VEFDAVIKIAVNNYEMWEFSYNKTEISFKHLMAVGIIIIIIISV